MLAQRTRGSVDCAWKCSDLGLKVVKACLDKNRLTVVDMFAPCGNVVETGEKRPHQITYINISHCDTPNRHFLSTRSARPLIAVGVEI